MVNLLKHFKNYSIFIFNTVNIDGYNSFVWKLLLRPSLLFKSVMGPWDQKNVGELLQKISYIFLSGVVRKEWGRHNHILSSLAQKWKGLLLLLFPFWALASGPWEKEWGSWETQSMSVGLSELWYTCILGRGTQVFGGQINVFFSTVSNSNSNYSLGKLFINELCGRNLDLVYFPPFFTIIL